MKTKSRILSRLVFSNVIKCPIILADSKGRRNVSSLIAKKERLQYAKEAASISNY